MYPACQIGTPATIDVADQWEEGHLKRGTPFFLFWDKFLGISTTGFRVPNGFNPTSFFNAIGSSRTPFICRVRTDFVFSERSWLERPLHLTHQRCCRSEKHKPDDQTVESTVNTVVAEEARTFVTLRPFQKTEKTTKMRSTSISCSNCKIPPSKSDV